MRQARVGRGVPSVAEELHDGLRKINGLLTPIAVGRNLGSTLPLTDKQTLQTLGGDRGTACRASRGEYGQRHNRRSPSQSLHRLPPSVFARRITMTFS